MKTVKRILAVALLVVTVLVVGYLVYTGSRTASVEESAAILEVVYEQAQNIYCLLYTSDAADEL